MLGATGFSAFDALNLLSSTTAPFAEDITNDLVNWWAGTPSTQPLEKAVSSMVPAVPQLNSSGGLANPNNYSAAPISKAPLVSALDNVNVNPSPSFSAAIDITNATNALTSGGSLNFGELLIAALGIILGIEVLKFVI